MTLRPGKRVGFSLFGAPSGSCHSIPQASSCSNGLTLSRPFGPISKVQRESEANQTKVQKHYHLSARLNRKPGLCNMKATLNIAQGFQRLTFIISI